MNNVVIALALMGKGMLGIFVVLILIMVFVMILSRLGNKRSETSNAD